MKQLERERLKIERKLSNVWTRAWNQEVIRIFARTIPKNAELYTSYIRAIYERSKRGIMREDLHLSGNDTDTEIVPRITRSRATWIQHELSREAQAAIDAREIANLETQLERPEIHDNITQQFSPTSTTKQPSPTLTNQQPSPTSTTLSHLNIPTILFHSNNFLIPLPLQ